MLKIPFSIRQPFKYLKWVLHYDYAPKGCDELSKEIETYFPNMRKIRSFNRNVPHTVRIDHRFPTVGWVTWDESCILYKYGKMLADKKMIEIGCWVGWSTVVLASSGIKLTVIDPVLGGMPQGEACKDSLSRAKQLESVKLISGYSPGKIYELADQGDSWEVFFIDGNHDGDAPLLDAQACAKLAPKDSIILLHDLIQPNICDALLWLQKNGWQCGVHYTSMFIGVAWRGDLKPIQHIADIGVDWKNIVPQLYPHLAAFEQL